MLHHFFHTLLDVLKIVPFLYLAFLVIEYIEHRLSKKNIKALTKSKKYGPLTGGLLGMIPQCGFSVLATNLYSGRIITVGTLIAVYLSTSDEMLPILLSHNMPVIRAITILLLKAGIGIILGFIIDLCFKKLFSDKKKIEEICVKENCHCHQNLFFASLKHTLSITLYILIATFIIGLLIENIETTKLSKILFQGNPLSYLILGLIGLIPNCASSVMITELYLNEVISFGNMMGGLLTSSGVGLLVLFRTNKNLKQNLIIMAIVYIIGILAGMLIDLIGIIL